ncbi:MerR family transcriptional regulator [Bacillus sp. FJAT-47783]|uniref:MerR family transcriptional regulator n=1 Tax=Bacillus sp. FJAT-47783 TaxID=2922712 RepID=UPI001FAD0590|nr:MerR family transcriptional regulator [Bacillus sp. FJAT-47783]
MKRRFRVGEVSKMFSIPQSTLRYYDEIGLFKPKYTDQENHYRYYTADQFIHLDTIIFLRKIGFKIRDIQKHMKERTAENTHKLFQKKLRDVKQEIRILELAAQKIEHKMNTLENGMWLAKHQTITFKTYPKRPISFLYHSEPIDLKYHFEDIYVQELKKGNSEPLNGGVFTGDIGAVVDSKSLYHNGPIMYKSIFKLLWHQQVTSEEAHLPEGLYACYPHRGPYENVDNSYKLLLNELNTLGYERVGEPIEIGIIDESVVKNEQHFITVIEIPVKKKHY